MKKIIKVIVCFCLVLTIFSTNYQASSTSTFYKDGSLKTKIYYYPNGKVKTRYTFYDGSKKTTGKKYKIDTYYRAGTLANTNVYNPNGSLKYNYRYTKGIWTKKTTYNNGKVGSIIWRAYKGNYTQKDVYYSSGKLAVRYKFGYNNRWNFRQLYYATGKVKEITYRDSRGNIQSQKKYYSNGKIYYSTNKVTKLNVSALKSSMGTLINQKRTYYNVSKLTYSSELQTYCDSENKEYVNRLVAFFQSYYKYPTFDQEYYMAHNGIANKMFYEARANNQSNLSKLKISYRRELADVDANQIITKLVSEKIDKGTLVDSKYKYYAVSIINKDDYNFIEVCYGY